MTLQTVQLTLKIAPHIGLILCLRQFENKNLWLHIWYEGFTILMVALRVGAQFERGSQTEIPSSLRSHNQLKLF